jgi:hypothetical protein
VKTSNVTRITFHTENRKQFIRVLINLLTHQQIFHF